MLPPLLFRLLSLLFPKMLLPLLFKLLSRDGSLFGCGLRLGGYTGSSSSSEDELEESDDAEEIPSSNVLTLSAV